MREVIHQCPPGCGKEHGGKPKCNNWHCKVCGNYCICSECHGLMFGKSKDTCKVCAKEWNDRPKGSFFESCLDWGGGDCSGRSLPYHDNEDGIVRVTKPKRVTVPVFEIGSCPSISIDEIKKRRLRRG